MIELVWMLATSQIDGLKNVDRARDLATEACELTEYKTPTCLDALAACYAESDDYASAVKWSEKALALIEKADDPRRPYYTRQLAKHKARKQLPAESRKEFVNPSVAELRNLIGKEQSVLFRVQIVGGNRHRYLNSRTHYSDADCFTAVVEPSAIEAFDKQYADPPLGKLMRVTGKVEVRNGQIQIHVTNLDAQLKLVDDASSSPRADKPRQGSGNQHRGTTVWDQD